jgi:hypothetical protein
VPSPSSVCVPLRELLCLLELRETTQELLHEFSLLRSLPPIERGLGGGTQSTSRLTLGCKSIQGMQNGLFSTGLGPIPLFRRSGVLLSISMSAKDNDDASKEVLGVIVSHKNGVHGCRACGGGEGDERCYLCAQNPFYEVLSENKLGVGDDLDISVQRTFRVSPCRAFGRVVEVGACLLLKLSAVQDVLPGFSMKVCFVCTGDALVCFISVPTFVLHASSNSRGLPRGRAACLTGG